MDSEPTDKRNAHVLIIPFPAQSHIKAMLKLARVLLYKGIHITFVNTEVNHKRLLKSSGSHYLEGTPGFQFETIPDGCQSTSDDDFESSTQALAELWSYLRTNLLGSFLELVSRLEKPVTCIISDGFMTYAGTIDAAEQLGIPIMLYWTLAACGFMGYYQSQVLMEKGLVPLKDESCLTNGFLDRVIDWIPGMKGIRLKDLPDYTRATKPDDDRFKFILETAKAAAKISHMIIHTLDKLEESLVEEFKSLFPHVYTIGPLQLLLNQMTEKEKEINIMNFSGYSLWKEEPECVQWLQSKEANSVLYVNFGSIGVMSAENLLEFGWGLANSNHYFLWIIRKDLVEGKPADFPPELEEAIKRRGFIASWCSQEEVLNHHSVGGFLTHGGWGSTIESLSSGVPMICWPFFEDQRINCRQMCKEWEVGMEIRSDVKRDEVEKLVYALLDGFEGRRMRIKAMEWKKLAEIATGPNGTSSLNMEKLVNDISVLSNN